VEQDGEKEDEVLEEGEQEGHIYATSAEGYMERFREEGGRGEQEKRKEV
jgi:hypothetical protein